MAKRNPAELAADKLDKTLDPLWRRVAAEIRAQVRDGATPEKAIERAMAKYNVSARLEKEILSSVQDLIQAQTGSPVSDPIGFRKTWLNRVWPGEEMSLAKSIANAAKMDDIREQIRVSLKAADTWTEMANKISSKGLLKKDLPGYISDLVDSAKKTYGGDPVAVAQYRRDVTKAMKNVERLGIDGAPNQRLRAAYQRVIDLSESGSERALNKAIERSTIEKMTYNAERITRTEMGKAYSQSVYEDVLSDDQVIGIGYDLSDRHPKTDICDFHTEANLYGMGPGRYPLSDLPKYPFHPNCLCTMYNVYSGEAGKFNPGAAKAFLKGKSDSEREELLGVSGAKQFAQSPGTWDKNLKNYEGHAPISKLAIVK
jgi:hypothetical protein